MRYFPLRREYQVAYMLVGLIFLGVSVPFWLAWNTLPEGDSRAFLYLARNVTVVILGVLLVLRPWRSRLGIDDARISHADGFLPARVIPLDSIRGVYSNKGKRMIVYLGSGRRVFIEYTFEGLDDFLALLSQRNIPILDRPLRRGRA